MIWFLHNSNTLPVLVKCHTLVVCFEILHLYYIRKGLKRPYWMGVWLTQNPYSPYFLIFFLVLTNSIMKNGPEKNGVHTLGGMGKYVQWKYGLGP